MRADAVLQSAMESMAKMGMSCFMGILFLGPMFDCKVFGSSDNRVESELFFEIWKEGVALDSSVNAS